jgi:hypothetical protein
MAGRITFFTKTGYGAMVLCGIHIWYQSDEFGMVKIEKNVNLTGSSYRTD